MKLAAKIREIIAYLRAITLVEGTGYRVTRTGAGTSLVVGRPRAGAAGVEAVEVLRVVGARRWTRDLWTGSDTGFVKCPYDGVTAPSFVAQEVYDGFNWNTMPADDGSDDRANAMYLDLAECRGPVFDVVPG